MTKIHQTIASMAALALATTFAPSAKADAARPAPTSPDEQVEVDPLPYTNGPMSAVALFIPDSEISEFDKPADQTPRVTRLTTLGVGGLAALKVIFKGPQRDAEGRIDVTFDVDFVGPDGKTLAGGSLKGLPAGQGTADDPEAIFDNSRVIPKLGFDADDPKGFYKAVIVLHDKVSGRDIPMTIQIERI